jgi:hypothetical protein
MIYQLVNQDRQYMLLMTDENSVPLMQGKQYTARSLCNRLEQLSASDEVDFTKARIGPSDLAKVMRAYAKRQANPSVAVVART